MSTGSPPAGAAADNDHSSRGPASVVPAPRSSAARRPREVRWVVLGLLVLAALQTLSAMLTLATRDERATELERSGTTLTEAQVEQSVALGGWISVGYAVALAATAVVSAVYAARGRRWARVTGTIVAAIAAALAVLGVVAGGTRAALGIAVLFPALGVVVGFYRRAANLYFLRSNSLTREGT